MLAAFKDLLSLLICICSNDEEDVARTVGFTPITVHHTTRPAVISFTHNSAVASKDAINKGKC